MRVNLLAPLPATMAKKKKTQLKPNPNRGFATTSTPKKAQPEPEAEPEPALLAATSGTQTPSVTQNGEAKAGDGQGGVDGEKSATRHEFDPAQEEEQALQNLVDKLQERVEKEVARAYKVRGRRCFAVVSCCSRELAPYPALTGCRVRPAPGKVSTVL